MSVSGIALPGGVLAAGDNPTLEDLREELADVLKRVGQHHKPSAVKETALMFPDLVQSDQEEIVESPAHVPFSQELPFLPVAVPDNTAYPSRFGPADHYDIFVERVEHRFFEDRPTPLWTFVNRLPGTRGGRVMPTIVAQLHKPVVVTYHNRVRVPFIPHRHGGHQPAVDDGFAADKIEPGQSRDFNYPSAALSNQGATMWYHDHREEVTSQHVYLGMAGFYIVQDPRELELQAAGFLPRGLAGTTGRRELEHDIPIVIQDKRFVPDGRLFYQVKPGDKGFLGDKIVVNGAIQPRFSVATRRYRLRFLNGATARDWNLAMSNGMPFLQIGTDGGLMSRPVLRRNILMGDAERYEVILDFSKEKVGSQIFLLNLFGNELWKEDDPVPIMRFDVVRQEQDDVKDPPEKLGEINPFVFPEPEEAVHHRRFEFERRGGLWVINDRTWDEDRDDARVVGGTVEIWDLVNKAGGWVHPIHIHEEFFRVWSHTEDEDELPVHNAPAYEALGLKDTVHLRFNQKARVIKRWPAEPDFLGRFVFHCHITDHEDHHMMGVINILPPGAAPGGATPGRPLPGGRSGA